MWDASQYLKYADERSRPFFDLLARVRIEAPARIADLGCGPGNLTRTLTERWPAAQVIGVDSSAAMLTQASAIADRLDFVQADLASWTPDQRIDLLVSNAALQWVDHHETLLARLAGLLVAGIGTLAIQMPYHFESSKAHSIMEETKADPRWSAALKGVGLNQQSVMPLVWYVERLHDLGFVVDAWETTYLHVLTGANPVLEWFKGSALRPLLNALEPQAKTEFLDEVGRRLKAAYPARGSVTLLPFPRLFLVATR